MSMDGAYDVPGLRVSYDYGREYFRCPEPDVTEENPVSEHWIWAGDHRPAVPRALVEHMTNNWATVTPSLKSPRRDVLCDATCAHRRRVLGPHDRRRNGQLQSSRQRHGLRFRAGTDFFYLTGCDEPDAVLVIDRGATDAFHALHRGRRDQSTHDFFTDARYGELWVGARRGVTRSRRYYEINTAPLESLEEDSRVGRDRDRQRSRIRQWSTTPRAEQGRRLLATTLSEHRLVKDDFRDRQLHWPSITPSRDSKTSYERCGRRGTRRARDRRVFTCARVSKATTWATTHCRQRFERDGVALDEEHRCGETRRSVVARRPVSNATTSTPPTSRGPLRSTGNTPRRSAASTISSSSLSRPASTRSSRRDLQGAHEAAMKIPLMSL